MEATGAVVEFTFTQPGYHATTLTVGGGNGEGTRQMNLLVMVKYVRREIRNSTATALTAFFDAMGVVYSTSQVCACVLLPLTWS